MTNRRLDCWALKVVFALLLLLPFVNILHFALPLPSFLFGKSTWLVLPVGILVLIYFWVNLQWAQRLWVHQKSLLLAASVIFPVWLVHASFYDEPALSTYPRFTVTMVVYIGLAEALLRRSEDALSVLSSALILQGLLVSLLVFFNINFFPNVQVEANEHGALGFTTTGGLVRSMLINASVGANHIVSAMFALCAVFLQKTQKSGRELTIFWCAMIFMVYVITLLGSRYPIAIALLLSSFAAFQLRGIRSFVLMFGAIFLLVLLSLGVSGSQSILAESKLLAFESRQLINPSLQFQENSDLTEKETTFASKILGASVLRFHENSGGREEKAMLAIKILGQSVRNFMVGPSAYETQTSTTDNGVRFSDNSFAMLMLYVGVPAALIFFALWAWYLRRYACSPLGLLCLVYLGGVLLLTNGLLWESWLCSVLFTLAVIGRYSEVTLPDKSRIKRQESNRILTRSAP